MKALRSALMVAVIGVVVATLVNLTGLVPLNVWHMWSVVAAVSALLWFLIHFGDDMELPIWPPTPRGETEPTRRRTGRTVRLMNLMDAADMGRRTSREDLALLLRTLASDRLRARGVSSDNPLVSAEADALSADLRRYLSRPERAPALSRSRLSAFLEEIDAL